MTEVRELLDRAVEEIADPVGGPPVGAIVAAGRRRVRHRLAAYSGAAAATVAVLVGVLAPLSPEAVRAPAGTPALRGGDGGWCAVRLDRFPLPGRAVRAGDGLPTNAAADLLRLHGWPRAVPYDVARWTLAADGDDGALIAWTDGSPYRYLPVARRDGTWEIVGGPCTP